MFAESKKQTDARTEGLRRHLQRLQSPLSFYPALLGSALTWGQGGFLDGCGLPAREARAAVPIRALTNTPGDDNSG